MRAVVTWAEGAVGHYATISAAPSLSANLTFWLNPGLSSKQRPWLVMLHRQMPGAVAFVGRPTAHKTLELAKAAAEKRLRAAARDL